MKRKKRTVKQQRQALARRIGLVSGVVVFSLVAVVARAYFLQIVKHEHYRSCQQRQSSSSLLVHADRGEIRAADGGELAVNVKTHSLYAEPRRLSNPAALARELAPLLERDEAWLAERLKGGRGFVWLQRFIDPDRVKRLRPLCENTVGLAFLKENQRVYPNRELAGQLLGFTDIDCRGLEGLEHHCEKYLQGQRLYLSRERDARRQIVESSDAPEIEYYQGKTVYLTIDRRLQAWAEKELESAVVDSRGRGGVALIMDADDGAVLAMAHYPRFNPNSRQRSNPVSWRNRAVTDLLEPGSTFKVFTLVAALESGLFRLSDKIDCEEGSYRVGSRTIHDTHEYELLRLDEILKYSSNIGCSKIISKVGAERFYQVLKNFGFGEASGIDFPHEPAGMLRSWRQWQPIDLCNIAFGQGVAVTSVQLVAAYAALANGGFRVQPYLVSRIINAAGWTVYEHRAPEPRRRACKPEVAKKLDQALAMVVEEDGTAPQAAMPGFRVAGKTGTAQKFDFEKKAYSHNDYWASFIGYVEAPAGKSRKIVYVMVDEPRSSIYGGMVAAPAFRRINQRLVAYLNYPGAAVASRLAETVWPAEDVEPQSRPAVKAGPAAMPDFTGLTIRDALALVGAYRGSLKIAGEGRIVAQQPAPGEPLNPGVDLEFRLSSRM